jgi:hypothetical protein
MAILALKHLWSMFTGKLIVIMLKRTIIISEHFVHIKKIVHTSMIKE